MEFKFPDSGHTIKLEGVSSFTLGLLRGQYEKDYPGKPVAPDMKIGEVTEKNPNDPDYIKQLDEWTTRMSQARWAAQKLYYASCVVDPDKEAVQKAILLVAPFMSLPETIQAGYSELGVPFAPELMEPYIYLFHVCITNAGEQQLFEDIVYNGTAPTKEAVDSAKFRLLRQV